MILPMIIAAIALGRSFRLDTMDPQNFVIQKDEINNLKVVIENPSTTTAYKMIESSSDVFDFLEVQGELSLFVKSNKISISGQGEYLTKKIDRSKTVEILCKVDTIQKTETLPTYSKLLTENWKRVKKLGTHYIRSITYGGRLLVSYQMESFESENVEQIKAVVKANLETSGSVNAELAGTLEKISKDLSSKAETRVQVFYTGGIIEGHNMDPKSAFELMENFPKMFQEYTANGKERIMEFELEPLNTINGSIPRPTLNENKNEIIDEAIDKYDDVHFAWSKTKNWFPHDSDHELKKKVSDFKKQLELTKNELKRAIDKLDLSKPFNVHHFDRAFEVYANKQINIPNRYTREMQALMNLEKRIVPEWYPYTRAVAEYTRWGNTKCSLPSPDPYIVGLAASAPKGSFGSGSNIQCVEPTPSLAQSKKTPQTIAEVNGLTYLTPDGDSGQLLCARCLLDNATSTFTVPAKTRCPGGTKLEYEGFMALGNSSATHPICIDKYPVDYHEDIVLSPDRDPRANFVVPMWIQCPECKHPDEAVHYVPCVVCSR